ncbi:hypothetical protein TKK_0001405 [Trichogramma kaykai]
MATSRCCATATRRRCHQSLTMTLLLMVMALVLIFHEGAAAPAKGGGRGGGRGRGRGGRLFGSRMPIIIPHRSPGAAGYYENPDAAKIVKASHFEFDYMLGRKITFFCMATGIPRPEITWFKDGVELYHHKFFQVHEWPMGNDTMKSKMEIDPATQKDAGYYECQADNQYAVDRRGFRTDYVMISY